MIEWKETELSEIGSCDAVIHKYGNDVDAGYLIVNNKYWFGNWNVDFICKLL